MVSIGYEIDSNQGSLYLIIEQRSNSMQQSVPIDQYKTIIHPILPHHTLVYGASFQNPSCDLVLYKEHMYSLFLLLYFHGEPLHKDIVLERIAECRVFHEERLRDELQEEPKSAGKSRKDKRNILDMLDYVEGQLNRQDMAYNTFHTIKQREYIRKSFKAIFEMDRKISIKKEMNVVDFARLAAYLIGATCQMENYYDFQVIKFKEKQFNARGTDVFIEISKEAQTYKYIKQKREQMMVSSVRSDSSERDPNLMYRKIRIMRAESLVFDSPSDDLEADSDFDDDSDFEESQVAARPASSNIVPDKVDRSQEDIMETNSNYESHSPELAPRATYSTVFVSPPEKSNNQQPLSGRTTDPTEKYMHIYDSMHEECPEEEERKVGKHHESSSEARSETHQLNWDRLQKQTQQFLQQRMEKVLKQTTLSDLLKRYDNKPSHELSAIFNPKLVRRAAHKKFSVFLLDEAMEEMVSSNLNKQIEGKQHESTDDEIIHSILKTLFIAKNNNSNSNKENNENKGQQYWDCHFIDQNGSNLMSMHENCRLNKNMISTKETVLLQRMGAPKQENSLSKTNYEPEVLQCSDRSRKICEDSLKLIELLRSQFVA